MLCLLCVFVSVPFVRLLCMVFIKSIAFNSIVLCLCHFSTRLCINKDIVKHTVHTIVSWPNHKQWVVHVYQSAWVKPTIHDDVIKWKHYPRYWPFVRGIHRSPVNSPHKGQWRVASMFSLICVWINDWVNNREAGDLRRYRAHYDVTLMPILLNFWFIAMFSLHVKPTHMTTSLCDRLCFLRWIYYNIFIQPYTASQ